MKNNQAITKANTTNLIEMNWPRRRGGDPEYSGEVCSNPSRRSHSAAALGFDLFASTVLLVF
jgi:hypothetical protein|uniref:Uncharacterized protein n=1 Tax=Oryza sativa subsp. japonica TaxID=39947 RepID=Q6H7U4_ORYSJ|nr:hypothetical protein [Oryza sativa Japonica Group]BAD28053.1 hypothetical protein [Oryza sativa Japonica Group]